MCIRCKYLSYYSNGSLQSWNMNFIPILKNNIFNFATKNPFEVYN